MTVVTIDKNEVDNDKQVIGSPIDFFNLMKPRVMSLVVFTAFVGYYISPYEEGYRLHPLLACIGILAIATGAGASGVLNQWYDRDIDKIMERTKNRPIPLGKIMPSEALAFGVVVAVVSIMVLGLAVNWLAAFLLAFTIFFYAVVYTVWLKRHTVQNIVIGGAPGSFPPVIGQVCATGYIGLESLVLFLIIFIWTPPHFWALALIKKEDYAAAKIPMLPIIAGDMVTRKYILYYSVALIPCSLLPWVLGFSGNIYLAISSILGLEFLRRAFIIYKEVTGSEKTMFLYSIFYLSILFAVICVDKFISNYY